MTGPARSTCGTTCCVRCCPAAFPGDRPRHRSSGHPASWATSCLVERQRDLLQIAAILGVEDLHGPDAWRRVLQPGDGLTTQLLALAAKAPAKPSPRFATRARTLLERLGRDDCRERLLTWLPALASAKADPDEPPVVPAETATLMIGLAHIADAYDDPAMLAAIADLGIAGYRKIPHFGALSGKLGTACARLLAERPDALGQLVRMHQRTAHPHPRRRWPSSSRRSLRAWASAPGSSSSTTSALTAELARTRRIPFLKVGRRTLFDSRLIGAWIAEQNVRCGPLVRASCRHSFPSGAREVRRRLRVSEDPAFHGTMTARSRSDGASDLRSTTSSKQDSSPTRSAQISCTTSRDSTVVDGRGARRLGRARYGWRRSSSDGREQAVQHPRRCAVEEVHGGPSLPFGDTCRAVRLERCESCHVATHLAEPYRAPAPHLSCARLLRARDEQDEIRRSTAKPGQRDDPSASHRARAARVDDRRAPPEDRTPHARVMHRDPHSTRARGVACAPLILGVQDAHRGAIGHAIDQGCLAHAGQSRHDDDGIRWEAEVHRFTVWTYPEVYAPRRAPFAGQLELGPAGDEVQSSCGELGCPVGEERAYRWDLGRIGR